MPFHTAKNLLDIGMNTIVLVLLYMLDFWRQTLYGRIKEKTESFTITNLSQRDMRSTVPLVITFSLLIYMQVLKQGSSASTNLYQFSFIKW